MIITKQKKMSDIKDSLKGEKSVFIVGCGECSATCKTGGEPEVKEMKTALEKDGIEVIGYCVPDAPCIAPQVKIALAKNKKAVERADSILILSCGLGAQSLKDNLYKDMPIHIGCDTFFMGQVDKKGAFLESCSACGECVLELTDAICPVTRCPKGLMNGPCGGQDKGKCEVDREKDCVWILIYESLKKRNKLDLFRRINNPQKNLNSKRPRKIVAGQP